LIGSCLRKVREEKAPLLLIVPVWRSHLSVALGCSADSEDSPPAVPAVLDTTASFGNPHPLMVAGQLQLAAWKLCIRQQQQAAGISGEASKLLAAGWSKGTNSTKMMG